MNTFIKVVVGMPILFVVVAQAASLIGEEKTPYVTAITTRPAPDSRIEACEDAQIDAKLALDRYQESQRPISARSGCEYERKHWPIASATVQVAYATCKRIDRGIPRATHDRYNDVGNWYNETMALCRVGRF